MTIDEHIIAHTEQLQREIQDAVWVKSGFPIRMKKWEALGAGLLKRAAINSPDISLEDMRMKSDLDNTVKSVKHALVASLSHLWNTTWARDLLDTIQTRELRRSGHRMLCPVYIPAISFFGKRVNAYKAGGSKWEINPKWRKSARQMIEFDPDTVHFLFPDPEKWVGDLVWRTTADEHGTTGFFRVNLAYAAQPVCSSLGKVITITPPGLRGWLWYWAWKLVGYQP
jgi:hypothetical protein